MRFQIQRVRFGQLIAVAAITCLNGVSFAQVPDADTLFATKVRPLLAQKCFSCHGDDPEKLEGELDLTSMDKMMAGGKFGDPAITPGNAADSLLYQAVTWEDPDLQMPKKENDRLTDEQTWWIRDWIDQGASWPADDVIAAILESVEDAEGVLVQTSGGLSEDWDQRRYKPEDLWAYQPLQKSAVPKTQDGQSSNPIDGFITRRLQELDVEPAPPADRRTLIRRATYDLTGLPPSPEEVDAFVNDKASDDDAFEKLIDQLLASPHYGEKWGQHWLDVVRYADSSGFANDFVRGNAWRYRDYVIRSFNEDKPYDQFVREQIAGDEIDPNDPEKIVAAGFLRMGPWELTSMEVPKVARQKFLDDVTDIVGQTFLSHPVQCARCHDHKFDPIPTRDYYSLQAVFATTQLAERAAPFLDEENRSGFEERKYVQDQVKHHESILQGLYEKSIRGARKWYRENNLDDAQFEQIVKKVEKQGSITNRYERVRSQLRSGGVAEDQIPPRHVDFTPRDYGLERVSRKGLQRLKWELDSYKPFAYSVYNGLTPERKAVNSPIRMPKNRMQEGLLEQPAILSGGDPFSPGEEVSPGHLTMLSALGMPDDTTIPEDFDGRRSALANWIARPDNPITSRSMVNRIWQWHFGTAIAGNPNNFGAMGKKPTHPELLDWLASTFVEEGWSIKKMHRRIMLSQAYRRSSEHAHPELLAERDPDGMSYAVFKPRRLSSEEYRDSMLFASGELNPTLGGVPVRPEMNMEVALQPRQVMGTYAAPWQPSPLPEHRHRRTIYALKLRGLPDPFMEVFNSPNPDNSCEAREISTITPQVFGLLNSQQSYSRALAFAHRAISNTTTKNEAIDYIFRLALGREPDAKERKQCVKHWKEMSKRHKSIDLPNQTYPSEVTREAVDENTGVAFSFTEHMNVYEDFVPDLQPGDVDEVTRGLAEVCLVLFNSNEFAYVY